MLEHFKLRFLDWIVENTDNLALTVGRELQADVPIPLELLFKLREQDGLAAVLDD